MLKKKNRQWGAMLMRIGMALNIITALVYLAYVALLLQLGIGSRGLNYFMLILTAVFCVLLLITFFLARGHIGKKVFKAQKKLYRYIKIFLRLTTSLFLIIGVISIGYSDANYASVLGAVVSIIICALSLLFDFLAHLVRKGVKRVKKAFSQDKPTAVP